MSEFVRVAHLSQVPPGSMHAVRVEKEDVVLFNVDGEIKATRDFCPHAGFALSQSRFRGKYVTCGLHDWEFDVCTGAYTANPGVRLRCYPVKLEGDDIWIRLEPLPAPARPQPPPTLSRDEA
jgi:nitrite reductase/ring-hydroxylating ferredoxin subunit